MSRLIDSDALFKAYENIGWYNNADRDEIAEKILLEQPTVNAVPVVRCKDCLYRDGNACDYSAVYVRSNGYCQWGRRREDETD